MALKKLLFIDANIWLDFYRARNEVGLGLLRRAEAISDKIIVTYQLESEFKRNRQRVILEAMKELKAPPQIPRIGMFSDAQASKGLNKSLRDVEKRVSKLRTQLGLSSQRCSHPAQTLGGYDPTDAGRRIILSK
jgi:PIN domain